MWQEERVVTREARIDGGPERERVYGASSLDGGLESPNEERDWSGKE